jgi:hypothetical protein
MWGREGFRGGLAIYKVTEANSVAQNGSQTVEQDQDNGGQQAHR